jgi:hypothetical protein
LNSGLHACKAGILLGHTFSSFFALIIFGNGVSGAVCLTWFGFFLALQIPFLIKGFVPVLTGT